VPTRRALLLGALACCAPGVRAADSIFDRLHRGGLVILMRHATTVPGGGDPANFKLGDCSTQRNLSEAGREESRRVGARLRAERTPIERVYTSPWCRCRDTAMLAFGEAEEWEPLGSYFERPDLDTEHTAQVLKRIAKYGRLKPKGNVVMVTHAVNIASLTKRSVATGEIVVVRPDGCCGLRVLEQLRL